MALAPITPRDRLQALVDLGKKTFGYWWLIGAFALVGGALSMAFAVTRPKHFESSAVLFYQEQIQSSILSNRQEEVQRNLGDRFRELLLSHTQLMQIIDDPKLNPYPGADPELAIDRLRQAIKFEPRGGNSFRITYGDGNAERAQDVTAKLAKLLQDTDEALRNDQAQNTVSFVTKQKEAAAIEVHRAQQELTTFLTQHPEFVQDASTPNTEGASIRAIRNQTKTAVATGDPKLYTLERQRERLQAILNAPANAPPIRVQAAPSPERAAAEVTINDAQRELNTAKRELDDALQKYTERHPTVISAQEKLAAAQERLQRAKASLPADVETEIVPTTPADRTKLQKDLATIENQIAEEQRSSSASKSSSTGSGAGSAVATTGSGAGSATIATTAATDSTNWIVELETKHSALTRALAEARERDTSLADAAFRAQLDANQKVAEQGGRLAMVDPAFKPLKPTGPGKSIFLIAGVVLFLALGTSLALGLAIIDDRLYRRADLEMLGVPVLAVVPPMIVARSKRPRGKAAT